MDNPEPPAALGTQDTGWRQSRATGSIGHTRHRTKTIQSHWQHWAHKTQDEEKHYNKKTTQYTTENWKNEQHGHFLHRKIRTIHWAKKKEKTTSICIFPPLILPTFHILECALYPRATYDSCWSLNNYRTEL